MSSDAIFGLLAGKAAFDHKRFGRDIKHFSKSDAPGASQPQRKRKLDTFLDKATHGGKTKAVRQRMPAVSEESLLGVEHRKQRKKLKNADQVDDGADQSAQRPVVSSGDGAQAQGLPSVIGPSAAPKATADSLRKQFDIHVDANVRCAPPLSGFEDLRSAYSCPLKLLKNVAEAGFQDPTAIQRQALPCLIQGHDLYAVAPTGSGKTLAFLLPAVLMSMKLRAASLGQGPTALIVSPTRELAAQTSRLAKLLMANTGCKSTLLSKSTAAGTDFSKVDVLSATPLLLCEILEEGKVVENNMKPTKNRSLRFPLIFFYLMKLRRKAVELSNLRLLILDEADKLFEEKRGFLDQIDVIFAATKAATDLQRALFSATLPNWVEAVASSVLQDPLHITVGAKNASSLDVDQKLLFVGREEGKLLALRQMIGDGLSPPVLVFVASKDRAKALHKELMYEKLRVDSIHADQSHAARSDAVDSFRMGKTWMLICTDLMARGMDFLGVSTVINYDFPTLKTDYIHRVGRTGRAGRRGNAVTFFTEDDAPRLQAIADCMRKAGCEVPEWMLLLKRGRSKSVNKHASISAAAAFEAREAKKKAQMVRQSKAKKHSTDDV